MDLNNYNPPSPNFQGYLGGNPIGSQPSQGTKKSSGLGALGPIGAGIDIASGLMGALDSVFGWSAKRQQRYQKELMDKQQSQWKEQQQLLNQAMLEQWNRENEYNDPTNYFKRLMAGSDANGLSKAAVLGDMPGGSVGQSASKSVPGSTSVPGVGGSSLLPFGGTSIMSSMRQRAETSLIEAQANYYESLSGKTKEETKLTNLKLATEEALRVNYGADSYAKRMAGLLSKIQGDNIETMQPFQIDSLISQSARDYEASLNSRKERGWMDSRYQKDMDTAEALIFLYGAERDAKIQLAREGKLNNDLFERTFEERVTEVLNRVAISSVDSEYHEGNIWWQRIGGLLGLTISAAGSYGTYSNGKRMAKTADRALDIKSRLSSQIVNTYKMDSKGNLVQTGAKTIENL